MKNLSIVSLFVMLCYACSNNQPADEKSTTGADFMKEEKPKTDLTIIDANAPVFQVSLKAKGNTMADMLYDKDTIRVPAKNTIELTLENTSKDSAMQHNFLVVENGSIQTVADAGLKAGVDKGFVPEIDEVLVSSKLTMPGEKIILRFAAPAKGIYEFVCTYPGHYARMKGVFVVE